MGYWGNRKPLFGTRINPDHPISQGLVAFWPFNEGMGATAYDLVRSGQSGLVQTTGTNPWLGDYFTLKSGESIGTGAQSLPSYLRLQPPLSLVWQGIFSAATATNAVIFGIAFSSPNGAPFFDYALTTDGGNGINFDRNNAGTRTTLLSGISGAANLGIEKQWACTLTTGAAAMYFNSLAKNAGGSSAGSSSITYNSTGFVVQNGPSRTKFGAIYNRVIPTDQMDWMRVEPFDHFEAPSTDPVVFLMSPPVGPYRLAGIGGGLAGPYAHLAGNM